MNGKYILDEHGEPRHEPDLLAWAMWYEKTAREVKNDEFDGMRVSTVFLSLDHNFWREGPPILWETMVFGGTLDHEQTRCGGSREQAEAMHAAMMERVQAVEALNL